MIGYGKSDLIWLAVWFQSVLSLFNCLTTADPGYWLQVFFCFCVLCRHTNQHHHHHHCHHHHRPTCITFLMHLTSLSSSLSTAFALNVSSSETPPAWKFHNVLKLNVRIHQKTRLQNQNVRLVEKTWRRAPVNSSWRPIALSTPSSNRTWKESAAWMK